MATVSSHQRSAGLWVVSSAVEVTIGSVDPLVIDRMWALGANGILERDTETVIGFDDEESAQHAIAQLPASTAWTMAPSPPLESWDSYATIVTDGRFVLHPPWLSVPETTSASPAIILTIDPGTAFGHGGHPTTLLALRALTKHVRPNDSVLDVGSGSGVLAIAASKLGATRVLATDIDPAAVAATRTNAARNDVEIESSDTRLHDIGETYDVVVANMERPTLASHLRELWQATGRVLILSGVLADDPLDLARTHPAACSVEQLGEWAATTIAR